MHPNADDIQRYLTNVQQANSEEAKKLLFQSLLTTLFQHDPDALALIQSMSKGAEKTIFNIPVSPKKRKTGRADTQYNSVIIEWEKDLKRTGIHAEEQLKEYLAGNLHSGNNTDFTLIATDGLEWRIYTRITSELLFQDLNDIQLRKVDSFKLTEQTLDDFPIFLDRYLFKLQLLKPTLADLVIHFGADSGVFMQVMSRIKSYVGDINSKPDIAVSYDEWKRFLSIAYGTFNESPDVFFVHTYLSAFSKLIAFIALSPKKTVPVTELQDILNGRAFEKFNVARFVEEDFYHWISTDAHFNALRAAFQLLADKLCDYDFSNVQEDIMKGIYQGLIDIDTRHALGEYYTPDWLCELVVKKMPLGKDSMILDPSCGSGSFLRAAIARLKAEHPTLSADALAKQVVGIDIHPLSVQIAKTTILLALGKSISHTKKPISLNVFLANSLLLPKGSAEISGELYDETYSVSIAGRQLAFSEKVFEESGFFDEAIKFIEAQAKRTQTKSLLSSNEFNALFISKFKGFASFADEFYQIYKSLKLAKDENRDSIWAFILQNTYKPFFLRRSFDVVIGNPPWFTYSSISNAEYQQNLLELAKRYNLVPASRANMPHLEIAAIFLAHSANYFLKPKGDLAFVLPRSFFTADQHDNTRSGLAEGFTLSEAWDLKDVAPLFNVPSCVLFAKASTAKDQIHRAVSERGIEGLTISAKLDVADMPIEQALPALTQTKTIWHYSILAKKKTFNRSALTPERYVNGNGSSPYAPRFKQGATIVPRNFYFIEIDQVYEGNPLEYEQLRVKSLVLPEAKAPWKSLTIERRIEPKFLYRTALAKNLVPFALVNPPLVLLPIQINTAKDGMKTVELLSAQQLLERGFDQTCYWFDKAEEFWEKYKTQNSRDISLYDWLNWQNKLTAQNLNTRYLVLYTASATDACAVVLDRRKMDTEFIVESVCYWYATSNKREANYLVSFLNSRAANDKIKAFQARGLFGERHVHKKILDLPFPLFDSKNETHLTLAELGATCAKEAQKFIDKHYANADLNARTLGRVRQEIRKNLSDKLSLIDTLVSLLLEAN
ncbi:MAG: N-6 DNA methylase [Chloroherpetonaceae bacterium]